MTMPEFDKFLSERGISANFGLLKEAFEAGRASMMAEFEQVELYDEVDVRVPGDIELLEAGTKLYRLKGEK